MHMTTASYLEVRLIRLLRGHDSTYIQTEKSYLITLNNIELTLPLDLALTLFIYSWLLIKTCIRICCIVQAETKHDFDALTFHIHLSRQKK